MKTVLCFGDSNTWGAPPSGVGRHPWNVRWTGALQQLLGAKVRVIEEGLGGRTTCFEDPSTPNRNGLRYLPIALESHSPLQLLIIMLGTNDLKKSFSLSSSEIAQGAGRLLELAVQFEPKIGDILLISPPHVARTANRALSEQFDGSLHKSKELAACYEQIAFRHGCHFFDGSSVAQSSPVDGIHLDAANHGSLARGLAGIVERILTERG